MSKFTAGLLYIVLCCTFNYTLCQASWEYQSLKRQINLMRETFEKCASFEREMAFMKFELEDIKSELREERKLTAGLKNLASDRTNMDVNQEPIDENEDLQRDDNGLQENITEHDYDISKLTKDIEKIKQSNVRFTISLSHGFQAEKLNRQHFENDLKKIIDETIANIESRQKQFMEETTGKMTNYIEGINITVKDITNNVLNIKEYTEETRSIVCGYGTFMYDPSDNHTYCGCNPGYDGVHCENDIDECISHPCQNGGKCVNGQDKFTCACAPGWTGADCGRVKKK